MVTVDCVVIPPSSSLTPLSDKELMTEEENEQKLPAAEVVFKKRDAPYGTDESEAWKEVVERDAARMRERMAAQRADRLAREARTTVA
jgi:hypothetical protein